MNRDPISGPGCDPISALGSTGALDTAGANDFSVAPFFARDWPVAQRMLLALYPATPPALWARGFERLQAVPPAATETALGVLLRQAGRVVGVALMLPSQRGVGASAQWRVNASSWAIEAPARSRALWMARQTLNQPGTVYTALTPIHSASRMLQRIGFAPVSHQCLLGFAPRLRQAAGAGTRVLSASETLHALRDHPLHPALQDHHRLDCVVCALATPDGLVPLVWRPRRRLRWLPVAELLYAPSQAVVAAHVGALARHLLGLGYALLEFEAQQDFVPDFACTRLFQRRFARGPYAAEGIDHLYSELVYLHR